MERKTKYRVLGSLVIIALVIILLPFFHNSNEFPTQATAVKAPPFPDQPTQVSVSSGPEDQQSLSTPQETAEANDSGIKLDTDDVISATHPSVINDVQVPEIGTPPKPVKENKEVKDTSSDETTPTQIPNSLLTDNESAIKRDSLVGSNQASSLKQASNDHEATNDNGLIDLKSAAWVIQIGSFKDKANALRMVNQLRANGYRAFIQKISTALGENTRVFVGPENKRTHAHELATRIENDLHIRGIVISYKPLSL